MTVKSWLLFLDRAIRDWETNNKPLIAQRIDETQQTKRLAISPLGSIDQQVSLVLDRKSSYNHVPSFSIENAMHTYNLMMIILTMIVSDNICDLPACHVLEILLKF